MPLSSKIIPSPVGALTLVANDRALVAVLWERENPARVRLGETVACRDHPLLCLAAAQLGEYFAGDRRHFDLPLAFHGTDFQRATWQELLKIPYGDTRSYAALATALGRPGAARAVGAANARNPISIIAPCHRVIGANGALTGFAGGLAAKQALLALERAG